MNKKSLITITGFLLVILFFCCGNGETTEEKAAKAAKEYCECYNKYSSTTKCDEALNKNYGSYANNDAFFKEFNANSRSTCGIYIVKKTQKSLTTTFQIKSEGQD